MRQQIIESCSSIIAVCAISAFVMDIMQPAVVILSFIWLGLQIWHFVKLRIKERRKKG